MGGLDLAGFLHSRRAIDDMCELRFAGTPASLTEVADLRDRILTIVTA